MRRLVPAVVAAFALLGGTARAAEVKVDATSRCNGDAACEKYSQGISAPQLVFTARAGETNDVTLSQQGTKLIVGDTASELTAGPGCTLADQHDASCEVASPLLIAAVVSLGDGADRFAVDGSVLPGVPGERRRG